MGPLSRGFGRLLEACFAVACLILLAMTLMICADVFARNTGVADLSWSNEVSETMLAVMTLLASPWLLRQGAHIRVDIVLRALPRPLAWGCEWLADLLGFGCSVVLAVYGWGVTVEAWQAGGMITKTLVTPEWWGTVPWLVGFTLIAIEFVFRMDRLRAAPVGARDETVCAS